MRVLTGLQPSGQLHLGNYFSSILPMIQAQNESDNEMFIFIANYHAMTSANAGQMLKNQTFELACGFLALGIDPQIYILATKRCKRCFGVLLDFIAIYAYGVIRACARL